MNVPKPGDRWRWAPSVLAVNHPVMDTIHTVEEVRGSLMHCSPLLVGGGLRIFQWDYRPEDFIWLPRNDLPEIPE